MDGDRLAEQLKERDGQMEGDNRSRNEDGRAGLGSLPGPAQPTGATAGLGCPVFGGKDGDAQHSAEPRLARRRETESGQRVPGVSQLQPLHRAGVTLNHSCPDTPNPGGLLCLWARLKGTRCSHPQPLHRAGVTLNHSCPDTPNPGGLLCLWARLKGTRCSHPQPRCSIIPLTPSMLWGAGLSQALSSWHAGLCLVGLLLG